MTGSRQRGRGKAACPGGVSATGRSFEEESSVLTAVITYLGLSLHNLIVGQIGLYVLFIFVFPQFLA